MGSKRHVSISPAYSLRPHLGTGRKAEVDAAVSSLGICKRRIPERFLFQKVGSIVPQFLEAGGRSQVWVSPDVLGYFKICIVIVEHHVIISGSAFRS